MTNKAKTHFKIMGVSLGSVTVIGAVLFCVWKAVLVNTMAFSNSDDIKEMKPTIQKHEAQISVLENDRLWIKEALKDNQKALDRIEGKL